MNRLNLETNGMLGRTFLVLLLGLATAGSACSRQTSRVEAYSPDIHYPTIELEEIAVLPAAPFAVAKSGDEYFMLNSTRDQAYWGRLGSASAAPIGAKGGKAGQYLNATDAGFVEGRDELYILDQKSQRLSFFSRDGNLRSTLPLGLLGIMGVKLSFIEGDYLIGATPVVDTGHRVIRVDSRGDPKQSFYEFPAEAAKKKLRPLSVPHLLVRGDEVWAAQTFSPRIERFSLDSTRLGSFGEAPAFYREPPSREGSDTRDLEEFKAWYRSWTPLFSILPYREGVARVFETVGSPHYVLDFIALDGSPLREPLMTDARPFAIEGGQIFLFQGKKVFRGTL